MFKAKVNDYKNKLLKQKFETMFIESLQFLMRSFQ